MPLSPEPVGNTATSEMEHSPDLDSSPPWEIDEQVQSLDIISTIQEVPIVEGLEPDLPEEAFVCQEVKLSARDLSALPWQQIIVQLKLKGMEAELANQAILIELNEQECVLSVDPMQAMAKTDRSVEKLAASLQQALGCSLRFVKGQFDYSTPAFLSKQRLDQQNNTAYQSIYNDQQVQDFMQILNMRVIERSIKSLSIT